MVGVPGKSKGCSTCRRRKKGCDQERPICGQCVQSGYICGGYKRDLTFIHHSATKVVEKAKLVHPPTTSPAIITDPFWNYSIVDSQCRSIFWDLYMPRGDCVVRDEMIMRCRHPGDWTRMVLEMPSGETALELAFSALTISSVGRENNDTRLVQESTKIYGKALKDLQTALYDPGRMYSDEVLTTCMILGLYEVFDGSARRNLGWISHIQGTARLFELRGPERHTGRQAHHVFLGARLPIISAGILRRKTTFLCSDAWLNLPWINQPKNYGDRLVDIMTRIPTLLEQVDISKVIYDPVEARQQRVKVLEQCRKTMQALHSWRSHAREASLPEFLTYGQREGDSYPFNTQLWFGNHLFAQGFIAYWMSCLVLSETIHDLLRSLQPTVAGQFELNDDSDVSDTFGKAEGADARKYAALIAQCVPYCLQLEMGTLGVSVIIFPMGFAFQVFRLAHEIDICHWFLEIFIKLKKRGLYIGNFLGACSDGEDGGHLDDFCNIPTGVSRAEETTQRCEITIEANSRDQEWFQPKLQRPWNFGICR